MLEQQEQVLLVVQLVEAGDGKGDLVKGVLRHQVLLLHGGDDGQAKVVHQHLPQHCLTIGLPV